MQTYPCPDASYWKCSTPKTLTVDFSSETVASRRQWDSIFKVLKEKIQPRILYPEKKSFKKENIIKILPDKQKLREFIAGRPTSQEYSRENFRVDKLPQMEFWVYIKKGHQ